MRKLPLKLLFFFHLKCRVFESGKHFHCSCAEKMNGKRWQAARKAFGVEFETRIPFHLCTYDCNFVETRTLYILAEKIGKYSFLFVIAIAETFEDRSSNATAVYALTFFFSLKRWKENRLKNKNGTRKKLVEMLYICKINRINLYLLYM